MDSRSPVYFFDFKPKPTGEITATGIQFVTQTLAAPADEVQFLTLKAADDDGHMAGLLRCFPGADILKEVAALPDQVGKNRLVALVAKWRERARVYYPQG